MPPSAALERSARNKRSYLNAKAAFNRGDVTACMAFYAEHHQLRSQEAGPGRQHIRAFLSGMREAWGDVRIIVEHAVAENDWVMGHCRATAIHAQTILGVPATGRRIEAGFWDLHRFDTEGLIVESWNMIDRLEIMRQLTPAQDDASGNSGRPIAKEGS